MVENRVSYKSKNIEVTYAPNRCVHAAECVSGLPKVFDPKKKPWVNVEAESPEKIVETIKKCPSGALQYIVEEGTKSEGDNKMEKTKITVMKNGPLMIEGNLSVSRMSGENIKDGDKLFLCRCGHSSNKPFCDGSHKKAEFTAE